jgi:hypothetical protein
LDGLRGRTGLHLHLLHVASLVAAGQCRGDKSGRKHIRRANFQSHYQTPFFSFFLKWDADGSDTRAQPIRRRRVGENAPWRSKPRPA